MVRAVFGDVFCSGKHRGSVVALNYITPALMMMSLAGLLKKMSLSDGGSKLGFWNENCFALRGWQAITQLPSPFLLWQHLERPAILPKNGIMVNQPWKHILVSLSPTSLAGHWWTLSDDLVCSHGGPECLGFCSKFLGSWLECLL